MILYFECVFPLQDQQGAENDSPYHAVQLLEDAERYYMLPTHRCEQLSRHADAAGLWVVM